MLCKGESALKIHKLSACRICLPILNTNIKLRDMTLAAKILLDSGSQVTVVTNKYITRKKLQDDLITTNPIMIRGINSDLSMSEKVINLDIMTNGELDQSIKTIAYIIETNNNDDDADIVLQANLSILILREPKGWEENEIETRWGKISINTEGNYMRINETKIQQKADDNVIWEKYYSETVQQRPYGRYVVRYPFKKDRTLGSSLPGARERFSHLEKEFSRDNKLKMQYEKFVEDLIENEHLIRLPGPLRHWVNEPANFLPHHSVYKKTEDTGGF
jgi:hypothetical protein